MTLENLIHNFAGWLDGSGEYSGVVVSSRVRLARNLKSVPFTHRATEEQQLRVIETVLAASNGSKHLEKAAFFNTDDLEDIDRQLLVERHLISPALAERKGQWGILVSEDETLSVMVNEEDHLRFQVILSGFQPRNGWDLASKADDEMSSSLEYAFSEKWGYLTACPTNTGTGLRASILIHLPALVLTQDMDRVVRGITQMGFAVRGFYGEGTEVVGSLFQISNQTTLGKLEEEILESLEKVSKQVIDAEQVARETLIKDARPQIEDKIWRAYGILENARLLTTQEFMNFSSAARLGYSLGVITHPGTRMLNELMMTTQPSHLQRLAGKQLGSSERDVLRASLVRQRLGRRESG